jgi:hypothetical protein
MPISATAARIALLLHLIIAAIHWRAAKSNEIAAHKDEEQRHVGP